MQEEALFDLVKFSKKGSANESGRTDNRIKGGTYRHAKTVI